MITHFLKRDFRTFKGLWLGLLAVLALVQFLFTSEQAFFSIMICYLFLALPAMQISGVKFRSQHIMSRNYILSLPVDRRRLFLIILLRHLVFAIPLLLVTLFHPAMSNYRRIYIAGSSISFILFLLIFGVSVSWYICNSLYLQLSGERISSHLTPRRRLLETIKMLLVIVTEYGVLAVCVGVFAVSYKSSYTLLELTAILAVCAAGLAWRYRSARRLWIGA